MLILGGDKIKDVYLGSTKIAKAYLGEKLVYQSFVSGMPYVVRSTDGTTLTFCYDEKKDTRDGTIYDIADQYSKAPSWRDTSIKSVVIESSFKYYKPTSTAYWFFKLSSATSFVGLKYINTSSVTNMNYMFYSCSAITSLDVSGWNTSSVTNMALIFQRCSAITSLRLFSIPPKVRTLTGSITSLCGKLKNIIVSGTISCTISFNGNPLTHESAISIINALDPNNVGTLGFAQITYDGLTDDDKALVVSKGWTVVIG